MPKLNKASGLRDEVNKPKPKLRYSKKYLCGQNRLTTIFDFVSSVVEAVPVRTMFFVINISTIKISYPNCIFLSTCWVFFNFLALVG